MSNGEIALGVFVFLIVLIIALYAAGIIPPLKKTVILPSTPPNAHPDTPNTPPNAHPDTPNTPPNTPPDTHPGDSEPPSGPSNPTRAPEVPKGIVADAKSFTFPATQLIPIIGERGADGRTPMTSSNENGIIIENALKYDTIDNTSIVVPRNSILQSIRFMSQQIGDLPIVMRGLTYVITSSEALLPLVAEIPIMGTNFGDVTKYGERTITLDQINAYRAEKGITPWNGSLRVGNLFTFELSAPTQDAAYRSRFNGDGTISTYLTVSTVFPTTST